MSSSPWGQIDSVSKLCAGVSNVTTPGHGGLRIAEGFANKRLSEAARKIAIHQGNYYFFEEDCNWAVAMYELPELWSAFFGDRVDDPKKYILESLSNWNPEYLLSRGGVPDAEGYGRWLQTQENLNLLAAKSPDLIVSAIDAGPGVVEVCCADGSTHFVTSESYAARSRLNLLSKCTVSAAPENYESRYNY